MTVPHLNQQHARVLREIFEHPVARNLEWPDVLSLMEHLGNVQQRHDGKYQIQIGTAQTIVERPQHKDVELTELLRLRTFLKEAGLEATGSQPAPGQSDISSGSRAVVAVDHHQARFFEFGSDGVHLVERDHLKPLDPHGFERHLEHRKEADYKGERVPTPTSTTSEWRSSSRARARFCSWEMRRGRAVPFGISRIISRRSTGIFGITLSEWRT